MNKKIFFIGLLGLGLAAAGLVVWFFVAFYISMERARNIAANCRPNSAPGNGTSAINRRCLPSPTPS